LTPAASHALRWPGIALVARGRTSGFLLVAGLLVLWELSARLGWVTSANWPPFSDVLRACAKGISDGELVAVVGSTLYRVACGYVLGVAAGTLVGFLFTGIPMLERCFGLMLELVRPIPIPAVIPPLVLLLGVDDPMKITVIAVTAFFPVLINTVQGIRSVEPTLLSVARTFQVPALATRTRVVLPAVLPFLLAGMRISLALALIASVVAEMIAGNSGIGHYLVLMQYATRPAEMYAGILLLSTVGYLLNWTMARVERRLLQWQNAGATDEFSTRP
jgi:ABC-type nitrate/sulfonate/bicarbonate transport system permease component